MVDVQVKRLIEIYPVELFLVKRFYQMNMNMNEEQLKFDYCANI